MNNTHILKSLFFALTVMLFSCSGDSNDDSGGGSDVTSITISKQFNNDIYVGDAIFFDVKTNNNDFVTTSANITVNGVSINGSNYTPQTAGVIDVVATYNGLTSNTLQITVLELPTKFTKNVLIEDYTGTWCGWCPRVAYGVEQVEAATDKSITVAIHRGSPSTSSSTHDPYNFNATALENIINLEGYPTAMLDRTTVWAYPEPSNVNQVVNLANEEADLGLALAPVLSNNNISLDVNVKFGTAVANPKLVVYVLENDLFYDQVNYTSYYGGGDILANFEHDNVLRATLTDLMGDQIPSAEVVADNVYSKNITVSVPGNVTNTSKMTIVAFVVNGNNNKVYNARVATFGETQTIEEL